MTNYTHSIIVVQGACFLIGAGIASMLFWVVETPSVGVGWLAAGVVLAFGGSILQHRALRLKEMGR